MLPNLVIIGGLRCGTTSLHRHLLVHPEIFTSRPKGLDFFNADANFSKGVSWYESHFTVPSKVRGEASPHYSEPPHRYIQGILEKPVDIVAERMHSLLPKAKLLYIIRDPIDKVISTYLNGYYYNWHECRSIEEVLENLKDNPYVEGSKYYATLQKYLRYYSYNNIFIITLEELKNSPVTAMRKVLKFLEVDDYFFSENFLVKINASSDRRYITSIGRKALKKDSILNRLKILLPPSIRPWVKSAMYTTREKPQISDDLRARLTEVLKEDTDCLRKFTGQDFKDWSI